MAAFQITITPPARKNVQDKTSKVLELVTPKLILAPFNPTPEILFNEVLINCKSVKSLLIYNPSRVIVTVKFGHVEHDDRISVSESIVQLSSGEEKQIFVSWNPIQTGYLRKVVRVQDVSKTSRSFDVILSGTCYTVNKSLDTNKRKRLKDDNNKKKINATFEKPHSNFTMNLSQQQSEKNSNVYPLRRQTYTVKEKENRLPNNFSSKNNFLTSSPEYKTEFHNLNPLNENSIMTNVFNHNFELYDNVEVPNKYSNFESELKLKLITNTSNSNSNEEQIFLTRRSVFSTDLKQKENNNLLQNVSNFSDSLEDDECDSGPSMRKIKSRENVYLTPMKNYALDSLLESPPENVRQSVSKSFTCLSSKDEDTGANSFEKAFGRNSLLFISPPNKSGRRNRRSQDDLTIRRTVSSAISDRKKHLRSNINSRRRTPPNSARKHGETLKFSNYSVSSSIEKIKNQNPQSLKQVLRSHTDDPFLKQILYHDENWIDKQEKDIIKWMNSLLTPPVELNEENGEWTVNAAEVWLKSNKDCKLAPSIDNFAATLYHSPQQLYSLRKAASSLGASGPMRAVFRDLANIVEKKIIAIREDRDIHLDQGLRNKLLQLLACYNPLWLRIGLETVCGQKICIQSKVDFSGLALFIKKYLLSSSSVNKTKDHPAVLQIKKPAYKDYMKKYILQKFLLLIYFIDQAKIKKLIRHNPCLFTLNSEYKSSQDILLAFCGDLVVGRGDITKHLKAINYVVQYKQTCIDEYDYSICSLHDLRDGVRLARMFEILFAESDVCSKLRVPAISILQKIYNVSVSIKIAESKCKIEGEILAKDLVSGNREKILSFLWQIINNYLTPLYEKAAIKIQKWYRLNKFKKSVKLFIERKKHESATVIQATWKGYIVRKNVAPILVERKIQLKAANTIKRFLKAVILKKQRKEHCAAIIIQRKFRAYLLMRSQRSLYKKIIQSIIIIQNWYRCKVEQQKFLKIKLYTVFIQRQYRANLLMKQCRNDFLNTKKRIIYIQRVYMAKKAMMHDRVHYLLLRKNVLFIQQKYRALKFMKLERNRFLKLKTSAIKIQRFYRSSKLKQQERIKYLQLKNAALILQTRYRSNLLMKKEREEFLKLKYTAIFIQKQFRAKMLRNRFNQIRMCSVTIQRWWRSVKSKTYTMTLNANFLHMKKCVIFIQRLFRAKKAMIRDREQYILFKKAVIFTQQKYRGLKLMKLERNHFINLKTSVLKIQQSYRYLQLMRKERAEYLKLKNAVSFLQVRYRAKLSMKVEKERFLKLKCAAVFVQRQFRTKMHRNRFKQIRISAVTIQRWWRLVKSKKPVNELNESIYFSAEYIAATKIQAVWKGYIVRKKIILPKNLSALKSKKDIKENSDYKSTLGERYLKAIYHLQTSDMYNVITTALWNLETVTMWSAKLCEGVVHEGIVPIIFDLIARANRSEPSLELYRSSFSILVNLTRYRPTKTTIWNTMDKINDVLLVLQKMKITHDKLNVSVFRYAATFLWLLCQDKSTAECVANLFTVRQQIEKMMENLKRKFVKNTKTKHVFKSLPKTDADWYPNPNDIIFEDNYVAIFNVYQILYNN